MPLPELRSPLARAVVPVLGGIGVFVVLGLLTWGIAAYISGDSDRTEGLAPTEFELGDVERWSEIVADEGPILMPDLNTTSGERNVVLNHAGENAAEGWQVYYAFPENRDASCLVEQVRGTPRYTDCAGRTIDVTELARPDDVCPVVRDATTLSINLRCERSDRFASTATSTG